MFPASIFFQYNNSLQLNFRGLKHISYLLAIYDNIQLEISFGAFTTHFFLHCC